MRDSPDAPLTATEGRRRWCDVAGMALITAILVVPLPSAATPMLPPALPDLDWQRSIDGTCASPDGGSCANQLVSNPGAAGGQLQRLLSPAYDAGVDPLNGPTGSGRPSARAISNQLRSAGRPTANSHGNSSLLWAWGQFLAHDLGFSRSQVGAGAELMPIALPAGDPSGLSGSLPFARSQFDPATGNGGVPRQQISAVTAVIDASPVYGSDREWAALLRTFSGGRLKTADAAGLWLPGNGQLGIDGDPGNDNLPVAGDERAAEQLALTGMHTLMMREHNRLAGWVESVAPGLDDEAIYQIVRKLVGAELQAVTYNEFLPALLGAGLAPYAGFDAAVSPSIYNAFSTAAFRLHSMVNEAYLLPGATGDTMLALERCFFAGLEANSPCQLQNIGLEALMWGLTRQLAQERDPFVVEALSNNIVEGLGPQPILLDLEAFNTQRGRDHGLPDYDTARRELGLPARERSPLMLSVYGASGSVDLFIGGLDEPALPGSNFGETMQRIIMLQFEALRAGDCFFYLNPDLSACGVAAMPAFGEELVGWLNDLRLADLIRWNTDLDDIQETAMFVTAVRVAEPGALSMSAAGLVLVAAALAGRSGSGRKR